MIVESVLVFDLVPAVREFSRMRMVNRVVMGMVVFLRPHGKLCSQTLTSRETIGDERQRD